MSRHNIILVVLLVSEQKALPLITTFSLTLNSEYVLPGSEPLYPWYVPLQLPSRRSLTFLRSLLHKIVRFNFRFRAPHCLPRKRPANSFNFKTLAELSQLFVLEKVLNVMGVVSDFSIAGTLIFLLQRSRTGWKQTDTIVNRLILFSVNTGLVTSLCAIFALIFVRSEGGRVLPARVLPALLLCFSRPRL